LPEGLLALDKEFNGMLGFSHVSHSALDEEFGKAVR